MVSIRILYPQKERALTELADGTRLERDFTCWWVELPFTKKHNKKSAERGNEIQQIKIQIPAPRIRILHINV